MASSVVGRRQAVVQCAIPSRSVHTHASRPTRLSQVYIPTLPDDAVAHLDTIDSLRLLIRGGYLRQVRGAVVRRLT